MTTSKKTIEFTAKNVKAFTGWLKRFTSIDNSLLLEIDQSSSSFIAKSYNEERSVVKMSTIRFDEAGFLVKENNDSKRIKVGLFNIPRLIKIMDQFNDVEFTLTVEYQELISDNDTVCAGEKILLKNKLLKMNVDCTSLNIFKYIADNLFKETIAKIDVIGKFEFIKANLEKINTLNGLDDTDHIVMQFQFIDGEVKVSGKAYDLLLSDCILEKSINAGLTIFKDQYSNLDVENYDVQLGEDRLVFTSIDSDTITVISKAEE